MAGGIHEFTASGTMTGSPRNTLVEWIVALWENLDKQLTINPFKHCWLTVATDYSEDHLIHCLKPNQTCAAGLDWLNALHEVLLEEKINPF